MRRAGLRVLVAAGALGLSGCGWVALVHDTVLGPVSPVGEIHEVTVGSGFRVAAGGPVADASGEPLLRPYPADLVERLGAPHSLYSLVQGLEALVAGFSFVVQRSDREGRTPPPGASAALRPGLALDEVLRALGPPQLWIRRRDGSLLLYRARLRRELAFYVGVPPPAGAFLPVPGLGNLRFRYSTVDERAPRLLLFFDDRDVLRGVEASADAGEASR